MSRLILFTTASPTPFILKTIINLIMAVIYGASALLHGGDTHFSYTVSI